MACAQRVGTGWEQVWFAPTHGSFVLRHLEPFYTPSSHGYTPSRLHGHVEERAPPADGWVGCKRAVACAQHTNAGVGMSEAWDSTSSDDDERASPAFDQLRASVAMLGDQVRRDSQDAAAFSPQSQVRVWEEKAGGVPMDNSWVHENWDESSDDGCERDANV